MPTRDYCQNSVLFSRLCHLILLGLVISSLTIFLCSPWQCVLLSHIWNISWFRILSSSISIFCHVPIFVAIEAFRLPIFKVVIGFPNVHRLTSSSISCSYSYLVIMLFFCGLIPLTYWCYSHLPLLECFWYSYQWVSQYCFDNIMLYILFQQEDGMQLICIYFCGQCFELYHKVCYVLLSLLESLNFSFGICCLHLVTECCFHLFDKIFPILSSEFFI